MDPVALRCITGNYLNIKKGEIVYAIAFDTVGQYPNCVRLKGRKSWFWADNFVVQ